MSARNPVRLFCTDIDGTVYGDLNATRRFREFWTGLGDDHRPALCFNSGRLVDDQLELLETSPLPEPDFLIGGVGTRIWDRRKRRRLTAYEEPFADGWDLGMIRSALSRRPGVELQPEKFQTEFKSSWYWHGARDSDVEALRSEFQAAGLKVTVVYSSSRDLDILPAKADKGDALAWLCRHLGIRQSHTVVAGDTGNDLRMFQTPEVRGIVVGNAKPELLEGTAALDVFHASEPEADGVIQGLRHYGVG